MVPVEVAVGAGLDPHDVRLLATLTAAAVLASMTAATVASPASAAKKPRCQGKVATIVGTKKGERLVGTAKRDIIVARGGNDRIYGRGGNDLICAGTGHDLVVGGPGADVLWGQVGNDLLNGGLGVDKCFQGTGSGLWANCEIPVPIPPEPPTLVIAYSDVNTNHVYDTGDVMIAKIVDTKENGYIDAGDTILMGQYPTTPYAITPAAIRNTFEDWKTKSHTVALVEPSLADYVTVHSTTGGKHSWSRVSAVDDDEYWDSVPGYSSSILDRAGTGETDWIDTNPSSPSRPTSEVYLGGEGKGDDGFIDVEIYS